MAYPQNPLPGSDFKPRDDDPTPGLVPGKVYSEDSCRLWRNLTLIITESDWGTVEAQRWYDQGGPLKSPKNKQYNIPRKTIPTPPVSPTSKKAYTVSLDYRVMVDCRLHAPIKPEEGPNSLPTVKIEGKIITINWLQRQDCGKCSTIPSPDGKSKQPCGCSWKFNVGPMSKEEFSKHELYKHVSKDEPNLNWQKFPSEEIWKIERDAKNTPPSGDLPEGSSKTMKALLDKLLQTPASHCFKPSYGQPGYYESPCYSAQLCCNYNYEGTVMAPGVEWSI